MARVPRFVTREKALGVRVRKAMKKEDLFSRKDAKACLRQAGAKNAKIVPPPPAIRMVIKRKGLLEGQFVRL